MVENPSIKPRNLFSIAKRSFPQYSSIYWSKVKTPIHSYRRKLLKKIKDKTRNECGAQYERDSVLYIRDLAIRNIFENVKKEEDFDIYTAFVMAYEIIIDQNK